MPTVGAGFDGYLEVTLAGTVPTLLYLNQPISSPLELFALLGPVSVLDDLFVGPQTIDPTRAILVGSASDCAGSYLGGAVFSVDTADASTVLGHALPAFNAPTLVPDTLDPALASSQAGAFGALNVPVGKAKVTAKTFDGTTVADLEVWTRAGTSTVAILFPAP